MNILRFVHTNGAISEATEGVVYDLEYEDRGNEFKVIDMRSHAIIDGKVGSQLEVNIVDKLAISAKLIKFLTVTKNQETKTEQMDNKKQVDNEEDV